MAQHVAPSQKSKDQQPQGQQQYRQPPAGQQFPPQQYRSQQAGQQFPPQQYQQFQQTPMNVPISAGNDTLTLGNWMLTIFLTFIPVVGFIMTLVWAFSAKTASAKRNWARAVLLWLVIGVVAYIALVAIGVGVLGADRVMQIFQDSYSKALG